MKLIRSLVLATVATGLLAGSMPAGAQPLSAASGVTTPTVQVEQVRERRWRGKRHAWEGRRHWRRHGHWRHRRHDRGYGAGAAIAGAVIGLGLLGAAAQDPYDDGGYYYEPPYPYPPGPECDDTLPGHLSQC